MQIIFDVSLPIFAIVLCGFLAGKYKIIEQSGTRSLNNYIYYVALPALLFLSLAKAPLSQLANWPFIWATLGGIFGSFLLAIVLARTLLKQLLPTLALSGMGASYGTTGYMGIPITLAAFGPVAALPASFATILHIIPVITLVTLAFAFPSSASQASLRERGRVWQFLQPFLQNILLNPLNIAVVLGIFMTFFHVPLPQSINTFAQLLANSSGPVALFTVGLSLYGQRHALHNSKGSKLGIIITVLTKILLQPLITLFLMLFVFHGQGPWAAVAILMSALPVGATVYLFAQRYEQLREQTTVAISVLLIFLTKG